MFTHAPEARALRAYRTPAPVSLPAGSGASRAARPPAPATHARPWHAARLHCRSCTLARDSPRPISSACRMLRSSRALTASQVRRCFPVGTRWGVTRVSAWPSLGPVRCSQCLTCSSVDAPSSLRARALVPSAFGPTASLTHVPPAPDLFSRCSPDPCGTHTRAGRGAHTARPCRYIRAERARSTCCCGPLAVLPVTDDGAPSLPVQPASRIFHGLTVRWVAGRVTGHPL